MRAEFTPDNHYAGLLAQAKALFRITQSQEAIISTLRSKLTELESQLAMVGTAEIEAQRAANEQLTNEIELIAAKCERLTESFATLMEHSTGVAGLHLNGDVAQWSELTEGGRFEEWLLPLSEPRDQSIDALKAQWQAEALEEVASSVLADDPYKGEGADITANISVKALRFEAEAIRRKQRIESAKND